MTYLYNTTKKPSGYALVATLSIMILLMLLALSIMNLSLVTQKSSTMISYKESAQANARMALMLAIGKLQTEMGQDMRISAPANILDTSNPPLTGVWRSWEGSDHELTGDLTGRPIQPDYDSKKTDMNTDTEGRFVSWLVSGGDDTKLSVNAATLVLSTPTDDTIPLLSSGSLAVGDEREVHVAPVELEDNGAYAWWVSGENQKARISKPYSPANDDVAGWSNHNRSYIVTDPEVFGLNRLLSDSSPSEKLITTNTTKLIADATAETKAHESFHDLSVNSIGLLTNVATGGWRKDLSLLTERWEEQPEDGLELFQLTQGQHLEFTRPRMNTSYSGAIPEDHKREGSVFYPWTDYLDATRLPRSGRNWPNEHYVNRAAVASWAALADHATFYRKNQASSLSDTPTVEPQSWHFVGGANTYHAYHSTWVTPIIARFQIIYSHYGRNLATDPVSGVEEAEPAVLITPVVTLWNPFNYAIEFKDADAFRIKLTHALPIALGYQGSPLDDGQYWAVQRSQSSSSSPYTGRELSTSIQLRMTFNANQPSPGDSNALTLGPGETRVYSPTQVQGIGSVNLNMRPGLLHNGRYQGWFVELDGLLPDDDNNLPQNTSLQADARFDQTGVASMCGTKYEWGLKKSTSSLPGANSDKHGKVWTGYRVADAAPYYAPPNDFPEVSILSECVDDAEPFLSLVYGSKIAAIPLVQTDLDGRLKPVNRQSKGMAQARPATMVSNFLSGTWSFDHPGLDSLINSSYDFTYFYHSGSEDSYLPQANNSTAGGYIVTGMGAADGLSRLVMDELPTRPLSSLGQLSSWHLRGLNPTPPQAQNIIANSDAPPLIESSDVVNSSNPQKNSRVNEQQDDSYCANHLLFDDWFFSSIAPDLEDSKDLEENYTDFLTDADPLANRMYKPILEDQATSTTEAQGVYDAQVEPVDSWKTIASRFEVEGMFNVNSTSLKAWRALLGHARNQKIPYLDSDGSVELSNQVDYAFPRTEIASTSLAGDGTGNGSYALTDEFAGSRVFTSDMLDQLALNIVEQVRLRGPFLSLSEFVNRQLSNDDDLAVGGAIQVALNQLSDDATLNPFKVMQDESKESIANPNGHPEYAFPEAAVGYNTYGLPGWPRQADVLRSLAPILSARDDTFTIRAYGDARSADGEIEARVWCEAVVRRTREFVDPSEASDITTQPTSAANQEFGRRFQLISFRWLNADEV